LEYLDFVSTWLLQNYEDAEKWRYKWAIDPEGLEGMVSRLETFDHRHEFDRKHEQIFLHPVPFFQDQ
jgi:hypothetical protein